MELLEACCWVSEMKNPCIMDSIYMFFLTCIKDYFFVIKVCLLSCFFVSKVILNKDNLVYFLVAWDREYLDKGFNVSF